MLLFLDVQAVVEGDSAQKLLLQSLKDEARAGSLRKSELLLRALHGKQNPQHHLFDLQ